MLPCSTNVNAMPRKVRCALDIGNDTITDVKKLTYATDWSGQITVGQVVSAYISATVPTPNFSLAGANVSHSMGIGDPVEWVQIGTYRIDEESIRTRQGYTSFSAYDKLRYAINTYHSTGDKTLQAICNEVCAALGITSTTLPVSITIDSSILDGYTLRDVLGFIAGYCGKNAYLSPYGALQLRWFSSVGYTADGTRANIPYIGENNCTVSRLICQTQDGVLTSGSGEGIYFTCPFMTQARLNAMLSGLPLTYRKADVDIPYGNFCLQSGDIITVSTTGSNLSVPIMSNSWSYDGGLSSAVTSYGVSDYTGTANNAEHSVSAQRVQNILREKKAANRVTEEIKYATDLITGATGGIIRINMGGNGKPAEFLILSNGDIATAQRVFRLNENGLGFSQNGYNGPYETAITYDGHLVADVIAGNKISGVALESTEENLSADLSQILITGGSIEINDIYNNIVATKGRIRYKHQTGIYDTPTLAIEVEHGNNVSIGETDSQKLVYISDPGQDEETFRIYGEVKVFSDIWLPNMYNPDSNGSLLAKIQELEQRIEVLEQALDNGQ